MKKTFVIIPALVLMCSSVTFAAGTKDNSPVGIIKFMQPSVNITKDAFDNPIVAKIDNKNKNIVMENVTITNIQKKILKINNKFEIVEMVVGDEYESLNELKKQIKELNNYVYTNNLKLSSDTIVEQQVLESLSTVEDSLNKLLKTYNVELDDKDEFYQIKGTIKEINDKTIKVKSNKMIYEIKISDQTLIKTDYKKNDKVTIKYSGSTTAGEIVIIDKCLYLAVDENLL